MTAEARALAQALLNHHRQMCRGRTSGQRSTDLCVIPYGLLCEQADVSYWLGVRHALLSYFSSVRN